MACSNGAVETSEATHGQRASSAYLSEVPSGSPGPKRWPARSSYIVNHFLSHCAQLEPASSQPKKGRTEVYFPYAWGRPIV